MKTYKEFVAEAFSKIHPWKWENKNGRNQVATFYASDDADVLVEFDQNKRDEWIISFYRKDEVNLTKTGDQFSIFATVMDIIKDFIKREKPFEMKIFAAKKDRSKHTGRSSLYRRMIKTFVPKDYTYFEQDVGDGIEFWLTAKDW